MRYEAAIELGRTLMERYQISSTQFEAEQIEHPLLADHDDPIYNFYYDIPGKEITEDVATIASDEDITVEFVESTVEGGTRLRLLWSTRVDDVLSFKGNLGPHKHQQDITGTIRNKYDGIKNDDPDKVTATLSTAEKGTLYRVVIEAERLDKSWNGTDYKHVSYRLYVSGKERINHSEEFLIEDSPKEIIESLLPESEGLQHTMLTHPASEVSPAN